MTEGPAGSGFLLLDKPAGISSFKALHPLKRLFRGSKVGHAGTLDPAATGLLLAGIGAGTRLLEYLEGMPKTYEFIARFGLVSDTYDMEGAVAPGPGGSEAGRALDRPDVERALDAFRGPIRQAPPAYSAVKVDGVRAYDRARAGEAVTLAEREVEVHSLELLSLEDGVARLRMACSKGTYVRSLVHDLGRALGCGAVADGIRRTAIGPFRVEDAIPADALETASGAAGLLLPLETAVAHLPAAVLAAHRIDALIQGRPTAPGGYALRAPEAGPGKDPEADSGAAARDIRVVDGQGRLLAIATLSPEGQLCPKKVLVRN
jgi:tRNA pseudouridine55 synthase